ncbi:MAG TPA: S8 family serine peptidase [Gemmatimonadales bacterium]|nr:S8 family serine peptidase [Gemmatimonadales bacterium]
MLRLRSVGWPFILLVSGIFACGSDTVAPSNSEPTTPALVSAGAAPESIANRWIITLASGVTNASRISDSLAAVIGVRKYMDVMGTKSFVVINAKPALLAALRSNPLVSAVDTDHVVPLLSTQLLPTDGSLWALDLLDQRVGSQDFRFNYFYPGTGVHVYIIDTGIRGDHTEFTGRLGPGKTFIGPSAPDDPYQDLSNHGTAVASLAGGRTYGVAKNATLHSLRVIRSGATAAESDVVNALNWVAANAIRPAVVNMSIGGTYMIKTATANVLAARIPVVKAAGSLSTPDACSDPTNTEYHVIVVGGANQNLSRTDDSPYGTCIDLFAPGIQVRAASSAGPGAALTFGGTSSAAPLVTGIVAGMMQQIASAEPAAQFAWRAEAIVDLAATPSLAVASLNGSPNRFANSLFRYVDYQGPNVITTDASTSTSAIWALNRFGGDGSWTNYRWSVSVNGGPYQLVGTGPTYTRTFPANASYNMYLRATATSFADTANEVPLLVQVKPPPPPEPTPLPPPPGCTGCGCFQNQVSTNTNPC